MARGQIDLLINGNPHRVTGGDAFLSLSDYLRQRHRLIGTKIVCSEGDCGACTVLVADFTEPSPKYRPVDACIAWMFQLDRTHVVTVEGLEEAGALHPVQRAMVECHGSQCGFCTPGFVMAMTGAIENHDGKLDDDAIRYNLTGNLCRCTGYVQICDAARQVDPRKIKALVQRYPHDTLRTRFDDLERSVRVTDAGTGREVLVPTSLDEAVSYLADHPKARIVSGATDVGVALNKGLYELDKVLYLGRVTALKACAIEGDASVTLGAATTWSDAIDLLDGTLPELVKVLRVFGAPQIRNAATIGGNIINASPIADSVPLLFVTGAKLRLVSKQGERTIDINDFYLGYKKLDLQPGELLASVTFPLPAQTQALRLYKVSKRRDLDISTFTAAILLTLDGGTITEAKLAYGGVGPVVLRLPKTEAMLKGKALTEATMAEAGVLARQEITPITDVRASADYRLGLAETILIKAYFDIAPMEAAPA